MKWLFLVIALGLEAQAIQPDTQALAARLKSVRSYKQLPAKDFNEIQAQSIAWIDKRIRAQLTAEGLNAELSAAGILMPESSANDDIMFNVTGFLDKVAIDPIPGATGLSAVKIGVGLMCGFDETVLIYERDPIRSVGRLDHHDAEFQSAAAFSSLVVGKNRVGGALLIASGTFSVWCTSTYIGVDLRIDKIENGSLRTILSQAKGARFFDDSDKLIKISIDGNIVTFRYTASMGDAELMARPAIARYSISGNVATRVVPVALSRIGFIDEWLNMSDHEAGKWSEQHASSQRGAINAWFKNKAMHFENISRCPGSVQTWQITISRFVFHSEPTKKWFLLMTEAGAKQMRILGVGEEPLLGCTVVDRRALAEELPE